MKTETNMMGFQGTGEGGNSELFFDEYIVSVLQDEKVLQIYYTTM